MDKIFSPIKGRIVQLIENQGVVKEKFFEKTGISSSNFKGKGAESELGGDKIAKILTEFPFTNAEWLLTGKGSMLKSEEVATTHTQRGLKGLLPECIACSSKYESQQDALQEQLAASEAAMEHAIPYYTNDVLQGQALARLRRGEPVAPLRRIAGLPEFEGCAAFPVHGDEMAPLLTSGMIIFCRRIDHWREYLMWGHVYAIPTKVGNLRYIGRVYELDEDNFMIRRDNSLYAESRLPKKDVATMWLVEGRLDKII